MVLSDVTAVIDADRSKRPIYAGNAVKTVGRAMRPRSLPCGPPATPPWVRVARQRLEKIGGPGDAGLSSWVEGTGCLSDRARPDLCRDRGSAGWCRLKGELPPDRKAGDKLNAAVGAFARRVDSVCAE